MTETEWWECKYQSTLLNHVTATRKASDRKLRLLACALVRRDWEWLKEAGSKEAIEVVEQFADGAATAEQLEAAHDAAFEAMQDWGERYGSLEDFYTTEAVTHAWCCAWDKAEDAARHCFRDAINEEDCARVRDLFSFRPVVLDPGWITPTVLALAQSAYQERELPSGQLDRARLAVLADALEDAGCTEQVLLDHLRQPGHHLRGCWAIDVLTGRE